MSNFESVFIVTGQINEDGYKKELESLKKKFEKINEVEELGIKKLAYEVQGNKTGYYISITFNGTDEEVKEIERYCRIKDEIIKYIIIRKD